MSLQRHDDFQVGPTQPTVAECRLTGNPTQQNAATSVRTPAFESDLAFDFHIPEPRAQDDIQENSRAEKQDGCELQEPEALMPAAQVEPSSAVPDLGEILPQTAPCGGDPGFSLAQNIEITEPTTHKEPSVTLEQFEIAAIDTHQGITPPSLETNLASNIPVPEHDESNDNQGHLRAAEQGGGGSQKPENSRSVAHVASSNAALDLIEILTQNTPSGGPATREYAQVPNQNDLFGLNGNLNIPNSQQGEFDNIGENDGLYESRESCDPTRIRFTKEMLAQFDQDARECRNINDNLREHGSVQRAELETDEMEFLYENNLPLPHISVLFNEGSAARGQPNGQTISQPAQLRIDAEENRRHVQELGAKAVNKEITDQELSTIVPKRPKRPADLRHKPPSGRCHICNREANNTNRLVGCSKVEDYSCRKSFCVECMNKHSLGDFEEAFVQSEGGTWVCIHCRKVCPARSQCFKYGRTNEKMRISRIKNKSAGENSITGNEERANGHP